MFVLQNYLKGKWRIQEVEETQELSEYLRDVYYPLEKTRIIEREHVYKVKLYFSFGTVFMTHNRQPNGEQLLFETLVEAERAGAATGVVYEAVRI